MKELQALKHPKRIFYYISAWWATEWYRCLVPGRELQKRGYEVALDDNLPEIAKVESDVIVFCRQATAQAYREIYNANKNGILTVFDLDENVWQLDPDSIPYKFWHDEDHLRILERCLSISQVITTPTIALAKILRRFNPNVYVIPNMLPAEEWRVRRSSRRKKVVIGWAGSESHFKNLTILQSILPQILEEFPHVEVHLAGMWRYPFPPHKRIKALQAVEMKEYPKLLAKFDIALAPLLDSQFNRARSDLKYLEYAAVGLPVIASKVEPFTRAIKHGENGFLASSPKDWLKILRRLITQPDLRKKIGQQAKKFAAARTIEKNVFLWEEVYSLAKRGPEVRREARNRH
jgi:glycosyltransferase involved in cell wall biosynthesis